MVTTLQEMEGHLAELVDRASRGEEVLITVDGKPKARITAPEASSLDAKPFSVEDHAKWVAELRELSQQYTTSVPGTPLQQIMDELREERC